MEPNRTSDDTARAATFKKLRRKFSSSSAQDLRCYDMEEDKQDVSSPREVIEACMSSMDKGPESVDNNSTSESETSSSNPKTHSRWHKFINVGKISPIKKLPIIPPKTIPKLTSKKSLNARENVDADLSNFKSPWKNFSLLDLQTATSNFNPDNLIGKGGYAEVFKGSLADGQLVAVKKLNKGTSEEQIIGFLSEIGTIAHVDHPNTAKMLGYGVEGGTYLILELSPLGSLGSLLHALPYCSSLICLLVSNYSCCTTLYLLCVCVL